MRRARADRAGRVDARPQPGGASWSGRGGAMGCARVVVFAAIAACRGSDESSAPSPSPAASSPATLAPGEPTRLSAHPEASSPPPASSLSDSRAVRARPKSDLDLHTSPAAPFFADLDAQIESIARLAHADGRSVPRWKLLSSLHFARGKYREDLDEIALAADEIGRCIAIDPHDPSLTLTRADEEIALSRFKQARGDLDAAKRGGADPDALAEVEPDFDWNEGDYGRAIAAIRAAAADHPTLATLVRLGQLLNDLGDVDNADQAFDDAAKRLSGTNPIPVARFDVERARQLIAVGRIDEALLFARDALRRIPTYVAASEQLAAALQINGSDDEAVRILEDLSRRAAPPPSILSRLSRLYRARGSAHDADGAKWRAMYRYNELLVRYPEATYVEASKFFADLGGEPARAVELAKRAAAARPNAASWGALARAQLASGHAAEARESIDKALATPVQQGELFWTAARAYALLGEDARARALEMRARELNPAIDRIEPPLVPAGSVPRSEPPAP